jgi:hypothetical protein
MAAKMTKHEYLAQARYVETFEATVCGIPCIVGITYYNYVRPDRSACNPWDYEGGTDCEWELMDTRYRLAPWLSDKMDKMGKQNAVHDMIVKYLEEN